MNEEKNKLFHRLIEKIIFNYDPVFEENEYKIEETFKKALEFIGGTMESDQFEKDLKVSLNCQTYKEEFQAVGKTLIRWLKKE